MATKSPQNGGSGNANRKRKRAAANKEKQLAKVEAKEEVVENPSKKRELPPFKNKQKVLILCSRGVTHRYRHLMNDMRMLMPHGKKESKMDDKSHLGTINEIADLNNCNDVLFFECRKKEDLYLWVGKTPNGPSAKFLVLNVHTMDEMKLTGNAMRGSRPILSFDKGFEEQPHWLLVKELFVQVFGTPKGHRKSKPFIDHILHFSIVDDKIWFRNYQIVENEKKERTLVEIGPRFVLHLHRIFDGSFGGPTLYLNPNFISPNRMRQMQRKDVANRFLERKISKQLREKKEEELVLPENEIDNVWKA